MILEKLKFSLEDKTIKVNIIQYLLKPTTCDDKHCWWYLLDQGGTTKLNPLVDYTGYLMTYYSIEEAQSFHIQLEAEQINEYLVYSDLEETFNKFKVKIYDNNIEKIERFVVLLREAQFMEEHVGQSINNVYQCIVENILPNHIHYGNLLFLKAHFKTMAKSNSIRVELDEIEHKIIHASESIKDTLKDMYVNCVTLESCLNDINKQLNTVAYNTPASRLITKLLNPDSCMNNKTICPWIIPGEMAATTYIPKVIIPIIVERLEDDNVALIEKIVLKIIKENLESNPDMIAIEITPPPEGANATAILVNFMEQAVRQDIPSSMKKYFKQLLNRRKSRSQEIILDVPILSKVINIAFYLIRFDQ